MGTGEVSVICWLCCDACTAPIVGGCYIWDIITDCALVGLGCTHMWLETYSIVIPYWIWSLPLMCLTERNDARAPLVWLMHVPLGQCDTVPSSGVEHQSLLCCVWRLGVFYLQTRGWHMCCTRFWQCIDHNGCLISKHTLDQLGSDSYYVIHAGTCATW